MAPHRLTAREAQILRDSINSDAKTINIRLRQGEYQYDLAKGIAAFQLELKFPDVKDLVKKLYGEEEADETRFISKIQTILKKMERNDAIKILPKKKPWDLQRYALSSFKFEDVDKNLVTFATPQQITQTQDSLHSVLNSQDAHATKTGHIKIKTGILTFTIIASYLAVLWGFTQPTINPIIFVLTYSTAVTCALLLGKALARLLTLK